MFSAVHLKLYWKTGMPYSASRWFQGLGLGSEALWNNKMSLHKMSAVKLHQYSCDKLINPSSVWSSVTCLSWHAKLPAVIWFSYGNTPQMPAECEKFLAPFLWFSWVPCCLYTCTLTFMCTHTHLCHIIIVLLNPLN